MNYFLVMLVMAWSLLAGPLHADQRHLDVPEFAVGDQLVWQAGDDEWSETVTGIDGDNVIWQLSNGDVVTLSANFAYPTTEHNDSGGSTTNAIISVKGALFPLKRGNWIDIRYKESTGSDVLKRFCTVTGESRIAVPAGEFDVMEIRCQQLNRTKVWYFAPALGFYVRYDNIHRIDGLQRQDLVSFTRAAD